MGRKYKMTGCAKFFIVILILAPIAYFGASYFNGEDGVQNIKDLLGIDGEKIEQPVQKKSEATPSTKTDQSLIIERREKTIDSLKQINESLKQELETLKSTPEPDTEPDSEG